MIRHLPKNSGTCVLIALLGVAFALAGCDKKEQKPAPSPPAAAPKPAAPQPKPVLKPVSSALKLPPPPVNQFDFSSKKDPFKPFVVVKAEPSDVRGRKVLKDALPIHSFDVGQFRLIGIITGGRENLAEVVDPKGKGYVIKVGMTIGSNEGRVVSITSSGVDVLEQFRDDNGKVRKERVKITLPRKQ
jgi:type IV pilus assembly protein PilP